MHGTLLVVIRVEGTAIVTLEYLSMTTIMYRFPFVAFCSGPKMCIATISGGPVTGNS